MPRLRRYQVPMETLPALVERLPELFAPLDLVGLAIMLGCVWGMTLLIERANPARPSVSMLMNGYRAEWMKELAHRDVRIMDAQLLNTLRGGTAFFASTCLISIGGVAALIGQADRLVILLGDLGGAPVASATPVWEAKLMVILLMLINAFLKFVWAHRLFAYCAVMMGAMPAPGAEGLNAAIARSVELNSAAARSFNRGLRMIYFALAALGWFLGAFFLIFATLATAAMLYRREFLSRSRAALMPR